MKVAVITCYKLPDYGRAVVLRQALALDSRLEVIVVKNRHRSLLRYPEVCCRLIWARLSKRPDVYLLTFRGYEMLPAVLTIALGKPVIFDELINPLEVVHEHRQLYRGQWQERAMASWDFLGYIYYWFLKKCRFVIADTEVHASYSAHVSGLSLQRYKTIPVGADEAIFHTRQPASQSTTVQKQPFTVLYYSTMVPLHGLDYVLQAAEQLSLQADIQFILIGGNSAAQTAIKAAQDRGALLSWRQWVEPVDLPELIVQADLCLGGPFGATLQSQLVITSKTYQFLASGAPTLIGQTKATEASQLFHDKQNCLIVTQGNAKTIVQAIQWAKARPEQLATIGQAGRQLYEQHFSQKVIGQKLAGLIRQVVSA